MVLSPKIKCRPPTIFSLFIQHVFLVAYTFITKTDREVMHKTYDLTTYSTFDFFHGNRGLLLRLYHSYDDK